MCEASPPSSQNNFKPRPKVCAKFVQICAKILEFVLPPFSRYRGVHVLGASPPKCSDFPQTGFIRWGKVCANLCSNFRICATPVFEKMGVLEKIPAPPNAPIFPRPVSFDGKKFVQFVHKKSEFVLPPFLRKWGSKKKYQPPPQVLRFSPNWFQSTDKSLCKFVLKFQNLCYPRF